KFQLHHTGIKTSTIEVVLNAKGYFNCTIQELKLKGFETSVASNKISIAPYRN
ncbi:hypothetical protein HMPREF1554_02173, partial [Porphyromonas gingivalis F0569]